MDYDSVVFWLVCLSCLSGLVTVARRGLATGLGSVVVLSAILLVVVAGRF